jgi:hypothetical protein
MIAHLYFDQRHDCALLLADRGRLAVNRGATPRATGIAAIPAAPVSHADQHAALRSPPGQVRGFRAKKSFSTFNWPICRYRRSTYASPAGPWATLPPSKTLAAPSSSCFVPL